MLSFYRGADKKSVKMTLSGRSIPAIPASGIDLAKQVEPIYQQYETEIEAVLNSASEEECSYKPGPADWSANEVLAHLIHSELGWQNYATKLLEGMRAHMMALVAIFKRVSMGLQQSSLQKVTYSRSSKLMMLKP